MVVHSSRISLSCVGAGERSGICDAWQNHMEEREAKEAQLAPARSITAINSDLRNERRAVWRPAAALTRYWRMKWDLEGAASNPWLADSPEGRQFYQEEYCYTSLEKFRDALVRQLLTPAPDIGAVNWKKTNFAAGQHKYTNVKSEKIERAIADDLAWLAGHPTKRTGRGRQHSPVG
jgi:hypothetical protein